MHVNSQDVSNTLLEGKFGVPMIHKAPILTTMQPMIERILYFIDIVAKSENSPSLFIQAKLARFWLVDAGTF